MLRPPGSPGMTDEKHAMIAAYTPKISAQIRDEFGLDVRRGPIGAQTFAAHHAMKHARAKRPRRRVPRRGAARVLARRRGHREHDVLRKIGERLDLALDDELLSGQEPVSAEAVRNDVDQAAAYNIHGVPAFIFGNRYFVSGAQPLALLERAADAARQGRTAVH